MNDENMPASQASFEETPYEEARWEIVGESSPNVEFIPLDVKVVGRCEKVVDPMFADYGGTTNTDAKFFSHSGDGEGLSAEDAEAAAIELAPSFSEEELEERLVAERTLVEEQVRAELTASHASELKALQERYEALIGDLREQFLEREHSHASRATEVAVDLAKKLIEEAVEINPEYILPIIEEALGLSGTANVLQIRVSPQDLEFLEVMNLRKSFEEGEGKWKFVADDSIKLGCVVDTSAGEIDFQLDAAWERVREQVVKVLR